MPRAATIEKRRNGHKLAAVPKPLLRLDLGCGQNKRDGFEGVDSSPDCGADYVCDLTVVPWVFWSPRFERSMAVKDASVEQVHSSHFLEHLTGAQRIGFLDELWRVLVPGGTATIITPWHASARATQDPTHQWPPVSDNSYLYFNRGWREANKLDHYPIRCDFDFVPSYMLDLTTGVGQWNEERRGFAMRHHWNIISDLQVVLTKHELDCTRAPAGTCTCEARHRLVGGGP